MRYEGCATDKARIEALLVGEIALVDGAKPETLHRPVSDHVVDVAAHAERAMTIRDCACLGMRARYWPSGMGAGVLGCATGIFPRCEEGAGRDLGRRRQAARPGRGEDVPGL